MSLRNPIKDPEHEKPETLPSIRYRMADAITNELRKGGKEFYDELSDEELFGYATVLWDYHTDLRDEYSRREMSKAGYRWAAELQAQR